MSESESMLDIARGAYAYNSGRVSDLVRQLGFAGIAVVWTFRVGVAGEQESVVPDDLKVVLTLIVISLGLDFLQYVAGAVIWGVYGRLIEKSAATDVEPHRSINWLALILFWAKTGTLISAYLLLLGSLSSDIL